MADAETVVADAAAVAASTVAGGTRASFCAVNARPLFFVHLRDLLTFPQYASLISFLREQ